MSIDTKATPEITRAAERYLEQYGDPLVMNTYLKVTILVLAAVCFMLGALTYKSQKALASMHPMIVRINDVGRAEAIDYRNFQYRPQEAENKYYLTRWTELYFSRNRFTIERDQTSALYFLNSDVQRAVIDQERKDNIIQTYIKDSSLPYVDVEVKNVILDDLRLSPYSARIEFEKVYTNPADHTELKRERWTASVTYVFRENVKNNELAVDPLGLTIVRFRADQRSARAKGEDTMKSDERAALHRLLLIAQADTGQSRRVADFLLAWWNAAECGGFDLTCLWGVDRAIAEDMVVVFGGVARVHDYPDTLGFDAEFQSIVRGWRPELKD